MKLDSRYTLETGIPDGYRLEDDSGVYILEQDGPFEPAQGDDPTPRAAWRRAQTGGITVGANLLVTTLAVAVMLRAPVLSAAARPRSLTPDVTQNLLTTTLAPTVAPIRPQDFPAVSRHPLTAPADPTVNPITLLLTGAQPAVPFQAVDWPAVSRHPLTPFAEPSVSPLALLLTPAQPVIPFQAVPDSRVLRTKSLPVDGNANLLETTLAPAVGTPVLPVDWPGPLRRVGTIAELGPPNLLTTTLAVPVTMVPRAAFLSGSRHVQPLTPEPTLNLLTTTLAIAPGAAPFRPYDFTPPIRLLRDDRQRGYLEYLVLDDTVPFPPVLWPAPTRPLQVGRGAQDPILGLLDTTLKAVLPTVTVQATTSAIGTTATGNGTITDTGGEFESDRGFVYDILTHADPGNVAPGASGYANNVVASAGPYGVGAFSLTLTGLTPGLIYFVRAFARNSVGYDYSNTEDVFIADSGGVVSLLPFPWRRRGRR